MSDNPGFLGRVFGRLATEPRTTGDPPSANGASSMHLVWSSAPGPARSVSVDLTVVDPPTVPRLYFWALQAGFASGHSRHGAGHIGLQWHPKYPGSTAANWGGYASGGGELSGSALSVPSAVNNPNTGNYEWWPGLRYRMTIGPWQPDASGESGAWPGAITDLASGEVTELRRLYAPGPDIVDVSMWSEVFAACDHPSVTVRWSRPTWTLADGSSVAPAHMRVNYQSRAEGGCANTTASQDTGLANTGYLQTTNTDRVVAQGTHLEPPPANSATASG